MMSQEKSIHRDGKQNGSCQGLEEGNGELVRKGDSLSLGRWKSSGDEWY